MRVGINDRDGIQQALDQGADGILVPYINTAQEAREAVSAALYPTGAAPLTQPPACLPPRRTVGTELVCAGCSGHALGVLPAAFDEQEGAARSVALSPLPSSRPGSSRCCSSPLAPPPLRSAWVRGVV